MYLYVYIFVLMSIIGYYTQLFVLRAVEMESKQTTLADVMAVWHDEAYRIAKENKATLFGGAPSCALGKASGALADPTADCASVVSLPAGMTSDMTFNTIAYTADSINYVVTYVMDDANGFTKVGYSSAEVESQIRRLKIPVAYIGKTMNMDCNGTVGDYFMTTAKVGSDIVCFPISSGGVTFLPLGAVGMISVM